MLALGFVLPSNLCKWMLPHHVSQCLPMIDVLDIEGNRRNIILLLVGHRSLVTPIVRSILLMRLRPVSCDTEADQHYVSDRKLVADFGADSPGCGL